NANRAVVAVYDFGDDGQPESHSALLRRHKWIEHLLAEFWGNSGARVGNPDLDPIHIGSLARIATGTDCRHAQFATTIHTHSVVSILDQIDEGLLTKRLIERDLRQAGLILLLNSN